MFGMVVVKSNYNFIDLLSTTFCLLCGKIWWYLCYLFYIWILNGQSNAFRYSTWNKILCQKKKLGIKYINNIWLCSTHQHVIFGFVERKCKERKLRKLMDELYWWINLNYSSSSLCTDFRNFLSFYFLLNQIKSLWSVHFGYFIWIWLSFGFDGNN
jgi:hypothetical protein